MMDSYGRIHIFEVKSVNLSNNALLSNGSQYKEKMQELINCYKEASKLTDHIFYLPIQKQDEWNIIRCMNGENDTLTEEQFRNFVKQA